MEKTGDRLTIALSEVEKDRVVTTATKILPLVHKGLLHSLVPAKDHHAPGAQVHCVHRAILLAQLGVGRQTSQGFWSPETPPPVPAPSSKPRSLHLGERGQHVLGAKLQQVSQEWEGPGAWGQLTLAP